MQSLLFSKKELSQIGDNQMSVVNYGASWCGPCKRIAETFEQLALQYPAVVFLKVDVDADNQLAEDESIVSCPTFQIYIGRTKVAQFTGADKDVLRINVGHWHSTLKTSHYK